MANYRVSTNTNNTINKTTQDKTVKTIKEAKSKEMDLLRLFTIKHELLKISVYL
jgi:hypothetical protein